MIIVLSEVYLDSVRVLQKLETLFHGYEGAATPLFVFMGNFTSRPYTPGPGNMVWMRKCFDDLADIIAKFPSLNQSKFVLIPGNTDVTVCGSCCGTLPRPPLANSFTDKLRARVKNIHLATNPCRIIYSGHEMLFVRDNLLHKMRRGCVVAPSYEANIDLSEHLVKTICDQVHIIYISTHMFYFFILIINCDFLLTIPGSRYFETFVFWFDFSCCVNAMSTLFPVIYEIVSVRVRRLIFVRCRLLPNQSTGITIMP
jgi:hypothetical protein